MRLLILISMALFSCSNPKSIKSAKWEIQSYGKKASVRAIHAVNDQICWLSGSGGTFAYTIDAGKNWTSDTIPGATKLEFRDIHAFDKNTIITLSIGPGNNSRMYKTKDAGKTWKMVFKNEIEKAFFDAFDFWDDKNGITMSDAVDGKLVIFTTKDAGENWTQVDPNLIPDALENEGSFAASGTNLIIHPGGHVWIGGSTSPSRVYYSSDYGKSWNVYDTPIQSEAPSAGIFSLAFYDEKMGIAVGGNYSEKENTDRCVIITKDGGKSWHLPKNPNALEFRSCVRFVPGSKNAFAVGRTGSSFTNDFGQSWTTFDDVTYYTMSFAPNSDVAWAAGPNGNVARLSIQY